MIWPAANDPTRADATPVLDGWGWDEYWSAQDWLTWHSAMKTAFGVNVANQRFVTEWLKQGPFSAPMGARTFDAGFRDYARENGFLDALYGGLSVLAPAGAVVTDLPIGVANGVTGVANALSGAGEGFSTTGRALKWALPVILAGVVLLYTWPYVAPAFRKAAKA